MAPPLRTKLIEEPVTVDMARGAPADGGLPKEAGLYVFHVVGDVLPEVPAPVHPIDPTLRLLYVGTAPANASSKATLRSQVLNQHLGSPLSGSTFRRRLAALLWEEHGWEPRLDDKGKWSFGPEDAEALTAWQREHLHVSWLTVAKPWDRERSAIAELHPPLNIEKHPGNPFAVELDRARQHFEAVARAGGAFEQ